MNTALLQTLYSALNIATDAANRLRIIADAEATGNQAAIDKAYADAEAEDNALSDRLRAIAKP